MNWRGIRRTLPAIAAAMAILVSCAKTQKPTQYGWSSEDEKQIALAYHTLVDAVEKKDINLLMSLYSHRYLNVYGRQRQTYSTVQRAWEETFRNCSTIKMSVIVTDILIEGDRAVVQTTMCWKAKDTFGNVIASVEDLPGVDYWWKEDSQWKICGNQGMG